MELNTESNFPSVPSDEPGPNVCLLGLPGAGKTFSLGSAAEAGLEVFVIFTDPGRESLLESIQGKPWADKVHWATVKAAAPGLSSLKSLFKEINTKDQSALQKQSSIGGKDYRQMLDLVELLANFVDQNGQEFGDVTTWGNDRMLAIDGLSALNDMSMDLVVGGKPIKSVSDWGMAMDAQMRLIKQLINDTTCWFTLLAHIELNKDEVSGKIEKMPSLLGNKNSASFGKFFSDFVLCEDKGGRYTWSTQAANMQLKTRNLKGAAKELPPSFVPMVEKWASRYQD